MINQEEISFRDKARKDFEGKEYKGQVIFQIITTFNDCGAFSLRSECNENLAGNKWFQFIEYDEILSQCKKPFPKDGFTLEDAYDKNNSKLAHYVCSFHGCNHNYDNFPLVTLQELKDEAKRIIDLS